ncbi:MAG: type II secretion system protein GspF [Deltaproteobacteria bacterium HGW-Deltaproteobacteria-2]|nr:MAG: type II secretion system protein GspF [Deltaproteobacteria bacterium HGW-Deltaproteobacteria-2]
MPTYSYSSTTREGVIMEGVIEAHDEKSAINMLKNSGAIPLKIKLKKNGLISADNFSFKSAKNEVQTFTTELYALLGAGLPLDRSLNILTEITENKKMKEIISAILRSIREGSSFSDALEKHPQIFSGLYVNMVRAGESGGVLGVVLEKLIDFLESSKELKDHIFSALIYPVILVITGILSIIVLVTYVLPKFSVIFRDMGTQLPLPTQILIVFSNVILSTWWIIILIIIAGGFALRNYLKTEKGRYNWDDLKIKIMGDVILKLETARFCRTLGALLKSGVPLLQAIKNAKDIVGNYVISSALDKISAGIKKGQGIAKPLSDAKIFPNLALSMIKVGEETGQLDVMLIKIADTYEKSLKVSIKKFVSFLEPALILSMGLLTGFIVISMLMAIFSITDIPF